LDGNIWENCLTDTFSTFDHRNECNGDDQCDPGDYDDDNDGSVLIWFNFGYGRKK